MSSDEVQTGVARVLRDARTNAVLAWVLTGFVLAVTGGNLATGELLWAGFAASVGVLALYPPVHARNAQSMLPWEVLLLAALPLVGRTFASVPVTSQLATYLAVAAIALIVSVELQAFTPVEMTVRFAIAFVVIVTMAAAGLWAVVRFGLDSLFGTAFLFNPALTEAEIEHALMLEFVYSTAAGVLAGVLFVGYFRRFHRIEEALSEEVPL